jgi:hypothetical protein
MGIFKQRTPRGFQHQYIYVDERKERLKSMEERAKRDLGMLPPEEPTAEERLRGKIVEQTTHLKRRQENDNPIPTKRIILILALLIMILMVMLR